MYHPRPEMAQLSQVPQIKNGKPDFSPTFQKAELHNSTFFQPFTSNGGYRREEKSCKHWSLFIMLPSAVTANFFLFVRLNQEQLYVLNALKIREK